MPSRTDPELPPALAPLGPGTTHKLLPDECDCGLGPHDWDNRRYWYSDGQAVEITFGFVPPADSELAQDMVYRYSALIDGRMENRAHTVVHVLAPLAVEWDRPPGWIPPAPPRTPEQVDSFRWVDDDTIEVVRWGYNDGSPWGGYASVGGWRWREYKNRFRVERQPEETWVAVYWSYHSPFALGHESRQDAIDDLRAGENFERLSAVGIIEVGAEAGEFWEDIR